MSNERFLDYIWDVYYYSLDKRWEELRNILFLFTNECNCKDGMLLLYLAKQYDFELLYEYMDDLRRGKLIDLESVQNQCIKALLNGDMEYATYLMNFINSKGKGTHQEINMPYLNFAYNYMNYKTNGVVYKNLESDLSLEEEVIDELNKPIAIKDLVSTDRLTSLKKEFIIKTYVNTNTYSCTDRKGRYHIFTKVNEEIIDLDINELLSRVEYELYLGKISSAKDMVKKALIHTEGFNPEIVKLYNKLFNDEKILRLERHICEPDEVDNSYNILYSYNYGFDNLDLLFNQVKRNKQLDLSLYSDEEKGLLFLLIAREAYKNCIYNLGNKYLQMAKKYIKYPEVNYLYNYVNNNKDSLNYQIIKSIPDEVRLELKL